jgi:hypothetical protein
MQILKKTALNLALKTVLTKTKSRHQIKTKKNIKNTNLSATTHVIV